MKKRNFIFFFSFLILIILCLGGINIFTQNVLDPDNIIINNININKEKISISGSLTESAINYKSYKMKTKDNKLYIKIKGNTPLFGKLSNSFNINIKNDNYEEIYIQSKNESKNIIIWKKPTN